jgi:hypothetical protein
VATQILARQLPTGFAGPPSPRPDRPVLTLPAHRLPAVRLCLLFLATVLSSAIVLALAASVDPSGAAAASRPTTGLSVPVLQSVSKPKGSRRQSPSPRRRECAAAARTEKARKACAVAKAKAKAKKPTVSAEPFEPSLSPALASPSVQEPVNGEASPAEAPEPTAPEGSGSAPKSPGGSGLSPVETPPVELLPVELPPVETPPVELPPVELPPVEPPPVETPPVETPPVETPPVGPPVETFPDENPLAGSPVEAPLVETSSVGKSPTTTMLASSTNPSTVGQSVTFTATVSSTGATGTVDFKQSGVTIAGCSARPVSSGTATCTVTGLAAGWPWVTAVYSGDSSFAASTASGLTQTVSKKTTTTTVSSSVDPSTVGQSVTYTAMVSPVVAVGTVAFEEAGTPIAGCSEQPVSSGAATCTVTSLGAGGHWITAVYSGGSNYVKSTSPGLSQAVNKKAITTTASSSSNPSTVGEAVTYTATLNTAAATGTVEFKQAGLTIAGCAAQAVNAGNAQCAIVNHSSGWRLMTAIYSGDSNYAASTSAGLGQMVSKKNTTTTVSSSLNPSTVGEAVTYTATLNTAAATGTVEFKQAGVTIAGCAAQAVSAGSAECTVADLSAGWPLITAIYSGDSGYAASNAPALTQTVNKKTTVTTVSSSVDPSTVGQSVTYTAMVSPVVAVGTVAFEEAGTPIAGCSEQPVSSGAATCTATGYPTWSSYTVTAVYSGDSSHLASISSVFTQTVEPPIESTSPFRFFSPSSFWNDESSATAPLDPSSSAVMSAFDEEIAREEEAGRGPANIVTTAWSVPIYTVPADQPTVKVTLENTSQTSTLQEAWDAVPLPPNAQPATGTDKHLLVWQPSSDQLWEFWHLEHTSIGWQASWGGAMQNVSSNPGVYGAEAWPGATTSWGASASSLSIAGGLITLEDLEKGQINHALAIGIPNVRAGVYASPAQRTDGISTNPLSLPEGAHLRLDPNLNLAAMHLPRLTLMIAEAAQRYGIFVRDGAANMSFYAQDPTPTGANPYAGPHGYFEGKGSSQPLDSFPWSHLQLLKMELHSES